MTTLRQITWGLLATGVLTLTACAEQVVAPNDSASNGDLLAAKGGGGKPGGGGDPGTPIVFKMLEAGVTNVGGGHSCGLDINGKAYCWGYNGNYELGLGGKSKGGKTSPSAVTGGHKFHDLSIGMNHTCGIEDRGDGSGSGPILCWGWNDWGAVGMIGDGTNKNRSAPTYTALGTGTLFTDVYASNYRTCGIAVGGLLYCWGLNTSGEFGDGTTQLSSVPVLAAGGMRFKAISVATGTACGIDLSGAAWCWGANEFGGLGNGTPAGSASLTPVLASGGHSFTDIVVNSRTVCGLTVAGELYCWGQEGGIASGSNLLVPTPLSLGSIPDVTFTAVSTNFCAIGTSGQGYCWGSNLNGQLGAGTVGGESLTPVAVGGPGLFGTIRGGDQHACGVSTDGFGYCWGLNASGQLGDGSTASSASPTKVAGQ